MEAKKISFKIRNAKSHYKDAPNIIRPDPKHAPEWYQDCDYSCWHELIIVFSSIWWIGNKISCLTILFVRILKYFWKYQNPSVLNADGMACASPRYVFCRKLKENMSFWHIATKVLVVLSPCITFGQDREIIICTVDSHRRARERRKGR